MSVFLSLLNTDTNALYLLCLFGLLACYVCLPRLFVCASGPHH